MKREPAFLFKLAAALGTLLLLANCAVNPVTGQQNFTLMSEAEEIRTGRQADADVRKQYGVYDLPALQNYVNEVGQALAKKSHRPQLGYRFTVVDSPEINAFALPGGYIYITRGLLAYLNSEAELAAVLGHELGHVTARHGVQQYSAATAANVGAAILGALVPELGGQAGQTIMGLLGNSLLSGYSRDHELEADRLGAEYLARGGYNPQAMLKVIGVLKNQEIFDAAIAKQEGREPRRYHGVFATHPDNDTRLQQVVGEAGRFAAPNADERRPAFLRQIEGMIYGDSPAQGIVRDNTFQHGDLGFGLSFPRHWRIRNQPDRVMATSPQGDALVELRLIEKPRGTPVDFARQYFRLGFSSEISSTTVNGLPAAIVTSTQGGKPFRAGVIYHNNRAFVLAGSGISSAAASAAAAFNRYQAEITTAITSFHALTEAERKTIKPLLVKTLVVKKGAPSMRYAELAQKSPLGKNAEGYLRLLNGQYPGGEPVPGQTLKIVE